MGKWIAVYWSLTEEQLLHAEIILYAYAAGWRKLPHVRFLQSARASLELALAKAPTDCSLVLIHRPTYTIAYLFLLYQSYARDEHI
jgi:hypothetical protein